MKIGIWIRVSTDEQKKEGAGDTHKERAEWHAKSKGWEIVETYDLSGVSGKSVLDHPETQRMLADIRSGKIQALVFSKLSRLARNVRELLDLSKIFDEHNAAMVSLGESIDTSTSAGRLLYTIIGALAEWERDEISSRVSASVPVRARLGKSTGGIGPFGYKWVGAEKDKRLIPNTEEAAIVRRLFQIFLETQKILTTATQLNEEGHRSRKTTWRPTTVKRVLTDTVYIGQRRANYSSSKGEGKSWKTKPASEWVYADVEPIIEKEIWDRAKAILDGRPQKYATGVPKEGKYIFSGLLTCSCGQKMYVMPYDGMKNPRYVCRKCKAKINENIIEQSFCTLLKDLVVDPNKLAPETNLQSAIADRVERLGMLQRKATSVQTRINEAWELFHNKVVDQQGFKERYDPLRTQKEQLDQEIPRLKEELDSLRKLVENQGSAASMVRTVESMWPSLTYLEKLHVTKELVKSVSVQQENIIFYMYFLPQLSPASPVCKDDHTLRDSWR